VSLEVENVRISTLQVAGGASTACFFAIVARTWNKGNQQLQASPHFLVSRESHKKFQFDDFLKKIIGTV
jgi:hypothetical protein